MALKANSIDNGAYAFDCGKTLGPGVGGWRLLNRVPPDILTILCLAKALWKAP